jgi:peptidoglycan/xylan/chitin deacetylase (PgdA/CDA1 family)
MIIAHNIGILKNPNYNTREQILNSKGDLTFDGIYRNVWENRDILQEVLKTRKVILFVMGGYTGGNNKFDFTMPSEVLADWNQLMELAYMGCEIGWHTWTHARLTTLSEKDLIREITPPFPMRTFAYPYGEFTPKVIEIVRQAGFQEAYSVSVGDNSPYQKTRLFI